MKPGDLVKIKKNAKTQYSQADSNSRGLILSDPEIFGFMHRVHVMWSSDRSYNTCLEEWVNMDNLTVINEGDS